MLRHCTFALLALATLPARALDAQFVGSFGHAAAVLAIDGGEPTTIRVGQRRAGVTVISVEPDSVTLEVEGRRRVVRRGQYLRSAPATDSRESAVLSADARGHFFADGRINGGVVRFVVDTGATAIVLSAQDADRLGIDYRRGIVGTMQTADGPTRGWRVKLDRVRVGVIELQQVDAFVVERGPGVMLLGMSFLNRVEMVRNGDRMTLTRRY